MATPITQYDVVLVIIAILGLIAVIIGWVEKLAKPINALNITNTKLTDCVCSLEKQVDRLVTQNEKEHNEIWCTVNKQGEVIAEHTTAITVLQDRDKNSE